jgi:hypothetical protein
MQRIRALCLLVVGLLFLGCSDSSGPTDPEPPDPPLYGALVVPRISYEVDPLLVDAYQALAVDGNQIGHLGLSWAKVEISEQIRDWSSFDPHVEQARRRGMKLSVVIEFLHGGEGEAPAWRWPTFPDWDDPDLRLELSRFLRELAVRANGTIGYLWLGEGPDRNAALYPGTDEALAAFYADIADSARAAFPGTAVGTVTSPRLLAENGKEALVREILGSLDLIGLSVSTEEAAASPAAALDTMERAIAPWLDTRFAILDAGYPSGADHGSTEAEQAEFATLTAEWLRDRPSKLELFCWAAIHDPSATLAAEIADRRFPSSTVEAASLASWLRSVAMRRLDGSPKLARQAWVETHP